MFINQILTKLKSLVYSKSETDSLLNGKASSSHTHTKSQITDFPTIPSKVSQLTNDSGFITGVSWDSVSNKPSTFTPSSHTHTKTQITDFPSLATVATSGSYTDLSNKPTIPSNTNQLTNGAGFITSSGSCNYANSAGYASSAGSAGEVNTSVAAGGTKALVYADMADNDQFRILVGGSSDAGYVEIATADNGNEPIYVRQYNNGVFGSIVRTLTLLDGSGNTQFPGTVTAPTFSGNLNGNCSGTAGGVAWGNVSGRPTAVSQFTNDSGFITSAVKESSYGNDENYCLLYGDLLIQFGSNVIGAQSGSISFKKSFNSTPIIVVNYGDDVGYATPCCSDEAHTTYFTVRQATNSGLWRVNWIAIGKKG